MCDVQQYDIKVVGVVERAAAVTRFGDGWSADVRTTGEDGKVYMQKVNPPTETSKAAAIGWAIYKVLVARGWDLDL